MVEEEKQAEIHLGEEERRRKAVRLPSSTIANDWMHLPIVQKSHSYTTLAMAIHFEGYAYCTAFTATLRTFCIARTM